MSSDLHGMKHMGARSIDLNEATLAREDLSNVKAEAINLAKANLVQANLKNCHWTDSQFESSQCAGSDWSDATVRNCNFTRTDASTGRFDRARLEDSTAEGADFSRASFREAHLTETSFARSIFREAVLEGAEGDGVDFRGADLRSANLKGVRFDEADFRGADLRRADLSGGRFHSADFRGALLEGACFDEADWTGATFDQGEKPDSSIPAEDKGSAQANDAATTQTLDEFLGLLPRALSGEDPAAVMASVSELLSKTAKTADLSPEQRQSYEEYFSQLAESRTFDPSRVQQLVEALGSNSSEPPEELKAWLEPVLRAMQKGPKS